MAELTYVAIIKGIIPPFSWKVKRRSPGKTEVSGRTGVAETVEQAKAMARDAALDLERDRMNAISEQTVELFVVNEEGEFLSGASPDDVPDSVPENWTAP